MKVRYVGESFGVDSLTDQKIYTCLAVEWAPFGALLRIVDDSEEDYLYSPTNPAPLDGSSPGGKWEIIEDDENQSLYKAINRKRLKMR